MEETIISLFKKCIVGGLFFEYNPQIHLIHIYKIDSAGEIPLNERGYIGDWNYEKPIDVLNRIHNSVDEFLMEEELIND